MLGRRIREARVEEITLRIVCLFANDGPDDGPDPKRSLQKLLPVLLQTEHDKTLRIQPYVEGACCDIWTYYSRSPFNTILFDHSVVKLLGWTTTKLFEQLNSFFFKMRELLSQKGRLFVPELTNIFDFETIESVGSVYGLYVWLMEDMEYPLPMTSELSRCYITLPSFIECAILQE